MGFKIIDISRELSSEIAVWPGSRQFELKALASFEEGHSFRESEFSMNIHTGTHMDAPAHFVKNGGAVGSVDLQFLMGEVEVIEFLENRPIDLDFMKSCKLEVKKILFKTLNSTMHLNIFNENFIAITSEVAGYLIEQKITLVGIDGNSIQLFTDSSNKTHEVLLRNNVIVLEGLDLASAFPGLYKLIALPLKIDKAEGAPVRAILIKGQL